MRAGIRGSPTATPPEISHRILTDPSLAPADFVQELYLKELKAYKVPPVKESDAQGQVATFNTPSAPKSPEEADLTQGLREYETMAVEVEGGVVAAAEGGGKPVPQDWLVLEEDDDAAPHH
jgi:F-type H+-transporting ATPase subunit h